MNNRIVYIDDNVEDDEPLVKYLKDEDFEVKVINDPQSALEYIKNGQYDIVLLDLDMGPNAMNGNRLFDEIRKVNKQVPVVIVSGYIKNQQSGDYIRFINNEAKAIFNRTGDNSKITARIVEIRDELNRAPGAVLEDWITKTKEPDAVLMVTKDGRKFTAANVIKEIKLRTPLGLQFEKDLNRLTIDLIARGKEKI